MNEQVNTLINQRTGQSIPLVMQRLELSGQVYPIGAMLRLTHRFKTQEGDVPFEAVYVSMLPQNGALRRFTVKGSNFEVQSEMKPREKARQTYEGGIQEGRLSVLAETSADGLVSLNVGQVRPGEEITVILEVVVGVDVNDKGYRFRFPFTIPLGYHAQAKSHETSGGGKQELPSSVFGDLILPEWKSEGLHEISFNLDMETGGQIESVASPSHRISMRPKGPGSVVVGLAGGEETPNRDLVIDVQTEKPVFALFADSSVLDGTPSLLGPQEAPRWTAVIPSQMVPRTEAGIPRKICFILDRSGSMQGQPLDRAKKALLACLTTLNPTDEFGIVHFGTDYKAFHPNLVKADYENRKQATKFIHSITALGGTEMLSAIGAALKVMGEPGDIFLLTDGEVWETGQVIEQAATVGTRIHSLGIGAASKSKFLGALSRRSKGVSKLVGPSEDTATAALVLLNTIREPKQVGISAIVDPVTSGKRTETVDIGTVWDGLPVLINGVDLPKAIGLTLPDGGLPITMDKTLPVPDGMIALLFAGRQLEDLDSVYDVSVPGSPVREATEQKMENLSMTYGLASRAVSLCSVIQRVGDQAGVVPQQQVVPVRMPEGANAGAYFQGARGVGGGIRGMSVNSGPVFYLSDHAYDANPGYDQAPHRAVSANYMVSISDTGMGGTSLSWSSNEIGLGSTTTASVDTDIAYERPVTKGLMGETTSLASLGRKKMRRGGGMSGQSLMGSPSDDLLFLLSMLESDGGMPEHPMGRKLYTALVGLLALNAQIDVGVPMYGLHLKRMADFLMLQLVSPRLLECFRNPIRRVIGPWSDYLSDARLQDQVMQEQVWAEIEKAVNG